MRCPDTRRGGPLVAAIVLALAVAGCAATEPDPPRETVDPAEAAALLARLRKVPAPPPGSLRARLAVPAAADLDLFVTDPTQETVYFANSPSRSGGQLERDVRCDGPEPRVETVVFPDAAPGRYRVGIDFPRTCGDESIEVVPFAVGVDGHGSTETRSGTIRRERFLTIVLEVDVPAP